MRRKGLSPMPSDHINVTPLIDVIMCLIIFFLLCGKFAKDEANAKVKLPQAQLGQQMVDQQGRLVINVVPGEAVGGGRGDREIIVRTKVMRAEELGAYLVREQKANPELKVIIRADKDITYDYVSPVMVACAQANIQSVDYATQNEGEGER
jgi:biopolymer transport protein ExbD